MPHMDPATKTQMASAATLRGDNEESSRKPPPYLDQGLVTAQVSKSAFQCRPSGRCTHLFDEPAWPHRRAKHHMQHGTRSMTSSSCIAQVHHIAQAVLISHG